MFYTSSLLQQQGVVHGFFGRKGGISTGVFGSLNCRMRLEHGEVASNVLANRAIACKKLHLDLDQLHMVTQVHSDRVYTYDKVEQYVEADALVTNQPNIALGVQTADCAPILLADTEHKVIGAIHAGWRGVVAGIVENTVAAMVNLGAKPEAITAAIGPAIRQRIYEVSKEFKAEFLKQRKEGNRFFKTERGSIWFDLPGFCASILKAQGVENIDDTEINTYSNPSHFFSYRRSSHLGDIAFGGQISIISM